jgi:hypothetical protein
MEISRAMDILGLTDLDLLLKQVETIGIDPEKILAVFHLYVLSFVAEKHMGLLYEQAERTNVKKRLRMSHLQSLYRKLDLSRDVTRMTGALKAYVFAYKEYQEAKFLYEHAGQYKTTRLEVYDVKLNLKIIAHRQLTQSLGQKA